MSLPACQERVLHGMETALRTCEPRLASLFAIFTRLTRDEAIPRTEQLAPQPRLSWRRLRRAGTGRQRRRPVTAGRPASRLRRLVLVPALLIVAASLLIVGALTSTRSCGEMPVHMAFAMPVKGQSCAVDGAANHPGRVTGRSPGQQPQGLRP